MTNRDILELKRRYKKNNCTFSRMCGCYVNSQKEIVLRLDETFLNLADDEFYKYLEIAKKVLSGTVNNNLLELEFPLSEENEGGKQHFLMKLRKSGLKESDLLESFYQLIIDNYDYSGNYLILLFHDSYDVITRTSDNLKLDESEEVYEYLLCAVCPVTLTKPGLGYLEAENRIGSRYRDWVVSVPDSGFVFPAFTERSTDIHSVMFYTRDTNEPHVEFIEEALGCLPRQTATQQKNTFNDIIIKSVHDESERTAAMTEIQESLSLMIDEASDEPKAECSPVVLSSQDVQEILTEAELPEEITERITTAYEKSFGDNPPAAKHLIDNKLLTEGARVKKEKKLIRQVQTLQKKLEEITNNSDKENESYDIVLQVKPEKAEQISSQLFDGVKCLIIPVDENERIRINDTEL